MPRNKATINDNLDYVEVIDFEVDYSPLFKLLKEYNVPQDYFCNEAVKISDSTLQRFRENDNVEMNTIVKIIIGLNKLNPKRKHNIDDILIITYK